MNDKVTIGQPLMAIDMSYEGVPFTLIFNLVYLLSDKVSKGDKLIIMKQSYERLAYDEWCKNGIQQNPLKFNQKTKRVFLRNTMNEFITACITILSRIKD